MLPLLSALPPNAAVLLLTLGLTLIAIELNRPGMVLPGTLGLLIVLLSFAAILREHPQPMALALLFASATILLSQLRCSVRLWIVCLGTAAGIAGFAFLPRVGWFIAALCGLLLGAGTTLLTRIARRARQNKGLD
jgi:membrane-bound ClpP family serine protease